MKNFILFDFDGVIVDSFCIAFETRKLLCPDITENQCRRCFEGNVNDWESSFNIHTDACRHNAVEFDPLYKKRLKTEARIVPGIEAEITKLEKEYRLLVVSSSISSAIREFLEEHGLANHFVDILGKEVHKSKVEKIKMIFQKNKTHASMGTTPASIDAGVFFPYTKDRPCVLHKECMRMKVLFVTPEISSNSYDDLIASLRLNLQEAWGEEEETNIMMVGTRQLHSRFPGTDAVVFVSSRLEAEAEAFQARNRTTKVVLLEEFFLPGEVIRVNMLLPIDKVLRMIADPATRYIRRRLV